MFCYLDFRCYFEANGQNHMCCGVEEQILIQSRQRVDESKALEFISNPQVKHRTHLKDSCVS